MYILDALVAVYLTMLVVYVVLAFDYSFIEFYCLTKATFLGFLLMPPIALLVLFSMLFLPSYLLTSSLPCLLLLFLLPVWNLVRRGPTNITINVMKDGVTLIVMVVGPRLPRFLTGSKRVITNRLMTMLIGKEVGTT